MSYTFKLACKNNNFFINTYTIPYLLAFRNYQKKISTKSKIEGYILCHFNKNDFFRRK